AHAPRHEIARSWAPRCDRDHGYRARRSAGPSDRLRRVGSERQVDDPERGGRLARTRSLRSPHPCGEAAEHAGDLPPSLAPSGPATPVPEAALAPGGGAVRGEPRNAAALLIVVRAALRDARVRA